MHFINRLTSRRMAFITGLTFSVGWFFPSLRDQVEWYFWERRSLGARAFRSNKALCQKRKLRNRPDNLAESTKLRLNWDDLPVQSPNAHKIQSFMNQKGCSRLSPEPVILHKMATSGLGSSLHTWSQALCGAMTNDWSLITRGEWSWRDNYQCGSLNPQESPMACYFPKVETHGGVYKNDSLQPQITESTHSQFEVKAVSRDPFFVACDFERFSQQSNHTKQVSDFRAAAMEWLFSSVSLIVIQEAQKQWEHAFLQCGPAPSPEHMVTVHIRWGDKDSEMELQPISKYVAAIEEFEIPHPVHIYLASEDPDAIHQFLQAAESRDWIVHMSGPTTSRNNKNMVHFANGSNGLSSMGALLVSMQSNYYVLTLGSNWSRLINELRTNVLDVRCQNCTRAIDLVPGEWRRHRL